jgi:hypothetical protein
MGSHYLENELRQLSTRDAKLLDSLRDGSLDGVWYWDLEKPEHEWMSPEFWALFGFAPADKRHSPSEWQDLIHPDDLQVVLDNFERHSKDPSHPYDQIVRYRHRDGSTVWVRCRGLAIRDDAGKPLRMLGVHTDVTELKRTEEALRERTAELTRANERLQQALDDVKALSGLIPVCAHCRSVRDDDGFWKRFDTYLSSHRDVTVTHGICPDCAATHFPDDEAAK